MDGLIVVEVLDRRGRFINRFRLDSFPVTIGRALTNQIIVDDRFVCPKHARIVLSADGSPIVEDLGSVNGLYLLGAMERVQHATLRSGLRVRIGHTVLRFRSVDDPLEPTAIDHVGSFGQRALLVRSPVALAVCALSVLIFGLYFYLEEYESTTSGKLVLSSATILVLIMMWSVSWAFASRIVAQEWRYLAHTAVACIFGVGVLLLGTATSYYGFLHSTGWSLTLIESVAFIALFAWLLVAHLSLASSMSYRRRMLSAVLIAITFVGLIGFLDHYWDTEFSSTINFEVELKPVPDRWLPGESIESFLAGTEALKLKVDKLALEKVK